MYNDKKKNIKVSYSVDVTLTVLCSQFPQSGNCWGKHCWQQVHTCLLCNFTKIEKTRKSWSEMKKKKK